MKKLLGFVFALLLVGCGNTATTENVSKNGYSEYSVNVGVRQEKINNTSSIQSILLDVNSSTINYIIGMPFSKSGLNWTINLPPLPIGEELTFSIRALDNNITTYTDTINTVLIQGENNVSFNLAETNSSVSYIPTLKSVSIDQNYSIMTFKIFNYERDNLAYFLYSNDAIFTPSSGSITTFDINNINFLDINYSGFGTTGTYKNNTMVLTNTNNDRFSTQFDVVIDGIDNVNVVLNMPPNINSVDFNVSIDNNATIYANVSDDENDTLSYNWNITQGTAVIVGSATTNPIFITNYENNSTLSISLTVSDSAGSSSLINYILNN